MATCNINKDGDALIVSLSQDEARTAIFALQQMGDTLKKSADDPEECIFEEKAFLYHEMAKVYKLLYDLVENYDVDTHQRVDKFLNL